jgi:predicted O-methyltransferase YrrM
MSLGGSMSDYIALVRQLPDGARVVEIGSYEGGSVLTVAVASLDRDIVFYSVESWSGNLNGMMDGWSLPNPRKYNANLHERFPHLRLISCPCTSAAAAGCFADGSVDFILIDGCHDTSAVLRDIDLWKPKVRAGGIIAGDDWNWASVRGAVLRHLGEPNITSSGQVWWVRR